MLLSVATVFGQARALLTHNAGEWLRSALIEPFADFLRRYGKQAAC
jgi:PAT family beta-lactamase induction signal transducer AmpG